MNRQNHLTAAYYYAFSRFALGYYTFCEAAGDRDALSTQLLNLEEKLQRAVEGFLELTGSSDQPDAGDRGPDTAAADELRDQLVADTEQLLFHLDHLRIHEYALSRQEGRFFPVPETGLSQADLINRLMDYIMDGDGPLEVNRRIQEVVAELPARFTKNKFYSIIESSLKPYIGTPGQGLEEMLYQLRSTAGLAAPVARADVFEQLSSLCRELDLAEYKKLTGPLCLERRERLAKAMKEAVLCADYLLTLVELVNCLYAAVLAFPSAERLPVNGKLVRLTSGILEAGKAGQLDGLESCLQELEGVQEYYGALYQKGSTDPAAIFDEKTREIERKISLLLSSSRMVSLTEREEREAVTDRSFREELDKLISELDQRFRQLDKTAGRAMMTKALASIPVWFNSLDEIEQYISDSLESCLDPAERAACVRSLTGLLVDEDALV